jgi:hypothetical protein
MGRSLILVALAVAALASAPAAVARVCTAQWAPVCATKDGGQRTYSNPGCAKADGAEVVHQGPCAQPKPAPTKTPIFCAEVYQPVCGVKDGATKTYSSACFAKADGATVTAAGEGP